MFSSPRQQRDRSAERQTMKYSYGVGVLVAALMFILGGSFGGALFSRLGAFVIGGALLAILLDLVDGLFSGRRDPVD